MVFEEGTILINKSNKMKFRRFTDKDLGGIILTNPIFKESEELP